MERCHLYRQKRKLELSYRLCAGLTIGLSHEKTKWRRERSSLWWDHIVLETFDDDQWRENFRMGHATFNLLCEQLKGALEGADNPVRDSIEPSKKLAVALYWLASSCEYRSVGNLFGIAKSTVHKCVHETCNAIVDNLMEEYVQFPQGSNLSKVIKGYEDQWGFPNCAGAIDGCHIPIIGPSESHGDYINRKGWYSLILQAVCNHRYVFTDVNIGWPGRVHDARVFASSEIYHRAEAHQLLPAWNKRLGMPDEEFTLPIVILGDPAYPLRHWLLKPYADRQNLSEEKRMFNFRLSRARMTIENSFGRLKGRWRCLSKRLDVDVEFVCTVIAACVVLHNICELNKELYEENWGYENTDDDGWAVGTEGDEDADVSVEVTRDRLARAFYTSSV